MRSYFRKHPQELSSSKFDVFDCIINITPNYDWVKQSLTYTDMKHALSRGNYGSYIQVNDGRNKCNESSESILLTWREVLLGKSTSFSIFLPSLNNSTGNILSDELINSHLF